MKKLISLLLCIILIFCFASCGSNDKNLDATNEKATEGQQSETEAQSNTPQTGQQEENDEPTETPQATNINSSTVVDERNIKENTPMILFGQKGGTTPTGYSPLPTITYTASVNNADLSTNKISHSHGPASGGEPHHTVVSFQDTFDKYGALTLDRISTEKVLYLTFDCGYEYENLTSTVLDVLKEKNVKATFFCTLDHIKNQTVLITRMINEGHIVGNHSTTHPSFAEISREQMAKEIEETENYLRQNFGYAAKYFRFPAGEYNESALELINSLGYMSVFWSVAYDDWNTENVRGKDYATQKVIERLHNGAVILLHSVSKDNAEALGDIIDKAREMGYEFKNLDEYKA